MEELKHESPTCRVIACTKGISEEEFRALRLKGVGGSDAGPIMDLSTYRSGFIVASEKLQLVKNDYEENTFTKRGKRMEPVIRENFAKWAAEDENGIQLEIYESPYLYQAIDRPWMLANIDGLVRHPVYGLCVLEIKTADSRLEQYWKNNGIPDTYYAQVQHYMYVLGLQMAVVGVMIGLDFEIRYVPLNRDFIEDMIERERVFWCDYVEKGLLPVPSGLDEENAVLNELYAKPAKDSIDLSEHAEKIARHAELSAAIKVLDAEKKSITAFLKSVLTDAKRGAAPGYSVVWSRFKQKKFNKELFDKENPALSAKYTSEEDGGRLLVTALEEKAK